MTTAYQNGRKFFFRLGDDLAWAFHFILMVMVMIGQVVSWLLVIAIKWSRQRAVILHWNRIEVVLSHLSRIGRTSTLNLLGRRSTAVNCRWCQADPVLIDLLHNWRVCCRRRLGSRRSHTAHMKLLLARPHPCCITLILIWWSSTVRSTGSCWDTSTAAITNTITSLLLLVHFKSPLAKTRQSLDNSLVRWGSRRGRA